MKQLSQDSTSSLVDFFQKTFFSQFEFLNSGCGILTAIRVI